MVDPGEVVTTTLRREFNEEAMNSLETSDGERELNEQKINQFFEQYDSVNAKAYVVYVGLCW